MQENYISEISELYKAEFVNFKNEIPEILLQLLRPNVQDKLIKMHECKIIFYLYFLNHN